MKTKLIRLKKNGDIVMTRLVARYLNLYGETEKHMYEYEDGTKIVITEKEREELSNMKTDFSNLKDILEKIMIMKI